MDKRRQRSRPMTRMLTKYLKKRAEKKRKEFAAKLKYGKYWHQKLYPHRYTSEAGPR